MNEDEFKDQPDIARPLAPTLTVRRPRRPAIHIDPEESARRAKQRAAELARIEEGPRALATLKFPGDDGLKQAARRLVEQVAQIGKDHLQAHPSPWAADPPPEALSEVEERQEADMRELAAAVSDEGWRGLVPLFEAISTAIGKTKYGQGFLLRFVEGIVDVATIAGVDQLKKVRIGRSLGGKITSEANQKQAEKWHKTTLNFAIERRRENPKLTQEDLAAEIKANFKSVVPKEAQIILAIRNWERRGLLSTRNTRSAS